MARVFISYARADGEAVAQALQDRLAPQHEPWFDRSELEGGVDWELEIRSNIERCDVFIVVLTRGYMRPLSTARKELAFALDAFKPVVPLRIHGDADLGLLLRLTQWIDCVDPAPFDGCVQKLLAEIDELAAGRRRAARDLLAGRWDALQARTAELARAMVQDLFRPDLYVRREAAESGLARFLDGSAAALLVVGDSGVGKTTLLSQWTLELLEQRHVVLFYDCAALADADVEHEIARDLGLEEANALEEIERAAAGAEGRKKVFFVFDSLGDFRGPAGAPGLLRNIHKLATRIHSEQVRVAASCSSTAWTRLRRAAPFPLGARHYFQSGGDPFLRLEIFTDAERDEAYRRYREAFSLHSELDDLPHAVRERLRDPVVLRMIAEAYQGVPQPLLPANVGARVDRTFFQSRVVSAAEQLLVDRLAERMLAAKSSALPMTDLARDEHLGPMLLADDPLSTYAQLVEKRVLQEVPDLRAGLLVRFAHTRIAAYAIARHVLTQSQSAARSAAELVDMAGQFPLAWDIAKTLLLLAGDAAAVRTLAASHDLEERELAAETLVEQHAEDTPAARRQLQALLDGPSEAGRRTALKAAYSVGPEARDFFMRAAIDDDPSLRDAVKDTLYLIWRNESPSGRRSLADTFYLLWRHAPDFTYNFLYGLLDGISFLQPVQLARRVTFVLELMITIYINHCEDEDVIDRTAALMQELAVKRLHMDRVPAAIEKAIVRAFTSAFGRPILDWMLFADTMPIQDFFRLPAEQRAYLARIAEAFEPASDLAARENDLKTMLGAMMPIFNGAAAMAIGVHATHDFARTEPLVRRLWERGGATERLWILAAFSVLLKSTPPEWIPLLEELTRRYVDEHRGEFLGPQSRLPGDLDIVLLPLGLAYGKAGVEMPLFRELLEKALANGDTELAVRIISGLAGAGFYHPDALFEVVRPAFARLDDEAIAEALVTTMATVRTLHFDATDHFLNGAGAPEPLRRRINAAADVALVRRYIRVLGYYNNAVHFTVRYPRMRKPLSAGALKLLATAPTPYAFVADYTLGAMRMLRDSRFQLKEWTLPV